MVLGVWSAGYWLIALAIGGASQDAIDTPLLTLLLLPHGAFFALGIALCSMRGGNVTPERLALCGLALATALAEIVVHARTMAAVPGIVANPIWPVSIFVAGVAAIAAAGALQRPLVALVGVPALTILGRMTYPLYLLNLTVGAALTAALLRIGVPAAAALAGAAAIVTATAYGIARHVEPPVRNWLAGRISSRRAPAPDTLPSASLPNG